MTGPRFPRRRRFVVAVCMAAPALLMSIALSLLPAPASASAETAESGGTIVYEGGMQLSSSDGFTVDVTARLTVECANDASCTALVVITGGDFVASPTNDQALPFAAGRASADLPYYGDICQLRFIGAGAVTVDATPDAAIVTRQSAPVSTSCPDGSTATASAATVSGTLSYVSGASCLSDGTCPTPTPTPTLTPTETASPMPTTATIEPAVATEARDWDDPGVLSTLRPFRSIGTPSAALWSVTGAIVLSILIALPTVLLDATSERVTDRAEQRRRARGLAPADPSARPPLTVLGWPAALAGLLVAATASTYVDPEFAFDAAGWRTAAGIAAGFLVVIALGWAVVTAVMRSIRPQWRPRIEFRPLTLLFVITAVAFSIVSGFQPGVVFGLVAGVGFAGSISERARAGSALMLAGFMVVTGAAAWAGYSLLVPVFDNPDLLQLLALECLAAITIAGFSALPIALLPLRGLLGRAVWQWSRLVWVGLYAIAVGAFLFVLIPLPDSWQWVELDYLAWGIGYAVYCVVAVIAWAVSVRGAGSSATT
ncbi:hypothetical protein [Chryseoglobus sp. 28M-23]|uniref:hypothetical protein n=1 Tax=Chryseoglobus sp. 28M-23 TaxID=2772253 RepID=UPI001747ABDB|nr:hypothetical protein [Chryseoglobus sp. 28M-23]QOD92752.1 hypothetical protein IE160_07185 [Chryseoglobus sp. 28M-23]